MIATYPNASSSAANRAYPNSIRVGGFGNRSVFTPGSLAGS